VSVFRREWELAPEHPHFESQHAFFFQMGFGFHMFPAQAFSRGMFGVDILKKTDVLLDIGCGDGFFTRRFFAPACARVDALDIDPSAIRCAKSRHAARTIQYYLRDAILQPFPAADYNCVIWDGGIGHLSSDASRVVLKKISSALPADGIFAGSESLGIEGADHLQVFNRAEDLGQLMQPFFSNIQFRVVEYNLPWAGNLLRKEIYWRCSNSALRLREANWTLWERQQPEQ